MYNQLTTNVSGSTLTGSIYGGNTLSQTSLLSVSQIHVGTPNSYSNTVPTRQLNALFIISSPSEEIVRMETDGKVIWADGINIDAAAEGFAKSLSLGVEIIAGITSRVKREIRDSVFEELISIAKEKGTLTVGDIEYALRCCKIMDKLHEK